MKCQGKIMGFMLLIIAFAPLSLGFSGSGIGTEASPYIITSLSQLDEMHDDLTAHYRLANDIDATATSGWTDFCSQHPILGDPTYGDCTSCLSSGVFTATGKPGYGWAPLGWMSGDSFTGSLDGNGYTISNLFVNRTSWEVAWSCTLTNLNTQAEGQGFIATGSADVFDLTIDYAESYTDSISNSGCGLLACSGGDLTTIVINNSLMEGNLAELGLVTGIKDLGVVNGIDIYNSIINNTGSGDDIGGAFAVSHDIGTGLSSTFTNIQVLNTNIIAPNSDYVGGVFGYSRRPFNDVSFVDGTIKGDNYVGGIGGYTTETVNNAYVSVNIDATGDYVGGIIGESTSSTSTSNFNVWNSTIVGDNYVGGAFAKIVGDISQIEVNDSVIGAITSYVSGIVTETTNDISSASVLRSNISSDTYVSGIVSNSSGDIISVVSDQNFIKATGSFPWDGFAHPSIGDDYAAGIANLATSNISDAYFNGTVEGYYYVAGIVNNLSSSGIGSYWFSDGSVIGKAYMGGLASILNANLSYAQSGADIDEHITGGGSAGAAFYDVGSVLLKEVFVYGRHLFGDGLNKGFSFVYDQYISGSPPYNETYTDCDAVYFDLEAAEYLRSALSGGCAKPLSPTNDSYTTAAYPDEGDVWAIDSYQSFGPYEDADLAVDTDGLDFRTGTSSSGRWFYSGERPYLQYFFDSDIITTYEYIENVSVTPVLHEGDTLVGYARWDKGSGVATEAQILYKWYKNGASYSSGTTNNITRDSLVDINEDVLSVEKGDTYVLSVSSDEYIKYFNSSPVNVTNIVPVALNSRFEIVNGSIINLTGYCRASDGDSLDNVYFDYVWKRNGVTNVTGSTYNGTIFSSPQTQYINVANITDAGSGVNWTLECTARDEYNETSLNTVSYTAETGPAPEMIQALITPSFPESEDNLTGYCNATSLTANVSYNYSWYVDGVLYSTGQTPFVPQGVLYEVDTILSNETSNSEVWVFECIAYDNYTLSGALSDSVRNGNPNVPIINITSIIPDPIYTTDDANGSCVFSEVDGDALTVSHNWYVNDVLMLSSDNVIIDDNEVISPDYYYSGEANFPLFNNTYFVSEDNVTLECLVDDGGNQTANNVTITISSTPPTIDDSSITPIPSYSDNSLNGNCSGSDIDGDNLTYYYKWYKDGALFLSGNTIGDYPEGESVLVHTLPFSSIDVSERWIFSCSAYDGTNFSSYVNSTTIIIQDSPPILDYVDIEPSPALESSDLEGWCNASDYNGDNISYLWKWYKDGVLFSNNTILDCYQETATATSSCGGLDTGSYAWGSGFGAPVSYWAPSYDGDWSTNYLIENPTSTTYENFNYTIPSGSAGVLWRIKYVRPRGDFYQSPTVEFNISDYTGCFDTSRGYVYLRFQYQSSNEKTSLMCYDGVEWLTMLEETVDGTGTIWTGVYEEAVYWDYDSYPSGVPVNLANVSSINTSNNETWTFSCQPYGAGYYPDFQNYSVYISDAPYVTDVRIDPSSDPTVFDNLTGYCNATSNLGEDIYYNYTWYKEGVLFSNDSLPGNYTSGVEQELSTINSSETSPAEEWTLECTVYNFRGAGPSINTSVTIYNNPPVASNVSIIPDPLLSGQNAICGWSYYDFEGFSQNGTIVNWHVDGVNVQQETLDSPNSTISSSLFEKGDEVICSITPYDGYDYGDTVNASNIVDNTPPAFSYVDLVNDPSQKGDELICLLQDVEDADGDVTTNYYRFLDTDNITVLQDWSTDSDLDCEFTSGCEKGDEIMCQAYVTDGQSNSSIKNDTVSIINTPPEAQSVYIFPYIPDGTSDVECRYTYYDIDGDSESAQYFNWYLNDSLTIYDNETLNNSLIDTGDDWRCEVTVYDGFENSTPVNSTSVDVGGTSPSIILFDGEDGAAQEGEDYTLSWTWTDAQLPGGGPYQHYICYDDNITASGCGGYELCSLESSNTSLSCDFEVMSWMNSTAYLLVIDGGGQFSIIQTFDFDVNHKPLLNEMVFNVTYDSPNNRYECLATNYTDPDGDSTIVYYTFLDNLDQPLQSESATNTYIVGGEKYATHGLPVTCSVRVYDGAIYSDALELSDHFRTTSITRSDPVIVDEDITITAEYNNDTTILGVNISLKSPSNILYSNLPMEYNNATGEYEYVFSPGVLGPWEIYSIKAYEDGGESYLFRGQIDDVFVVEEEDAGDSGAGGGGGGTIEIIELPKVSNITGYCGDSICQDGENPANCWQDCKINYDTLITCIWDEDVDCNYNETWFPTFILILLGSVGLVAIYRYEFAGDNK